MVFTKFCGERSARGTEFRPGKTPLGRWQKLNVTFVPTFVANKSLTFTLSSSDIAQA